MITTQLLLFIGIGAGLGFGVLALLIATKGTSRTVPVPPRLQFWRWTRAQKLRWLSAFGAALVVLLVTRWIVLAIATLVVITFWPALFGGARDQQQKIRRLEALAGWVESLRDIIKANLALPEALLLSSRTAPAELQEPLKLLVERMNTQLPLDTILLQFADDLNDPVADSVMGALTMNARVQGKRLNIVLTSLAESVRKQLSIRRQIEAERSGLRRSVSIIMIVSGLFLVGMTIFNPQTRDAYGSVTGQIVLTIIIALFAGGFVWMRQLADFQTPQRFLATPDVIAHNQQLAAARSLDRRRGNATNEFDLDPAYTSTTVATVAR